MLSIRGAKAQETKVQPNHLLKILNYTVLSLVHRRRLNRTRRILEWADTQDKLLGTAKLQLRSHFQNGHFLPPRRPRARVGIR
jgi:hypothetical protein